MENNIFINEEQANRLLLYITSFDDTSTALVVRLTKKLVADFYGSDETIRLLTAYASGLMPREGIKITYTYLDKGVRKWRVFVVKNLHLFKDVGSRRSSVDYSYLSVPIKFEVEEVGR